jgi:hypothetical protein
MRKVVIENCVKQDEGFIADGEREICAGSSRN